MYVNKFLWVLYVKVELLCQIMPNSFLRDWTSLLPSSSICEFQLFHILESTWYCQFKTFFRLFLVYNDISCGFNFLSLVTTDVEHFFTANWMTSFVNCLFKSFACFSVFLSDLSEFFIYFD